MSIKIKIHEINIEANSAIVTISDDDYILVDKKRCLNIKLNNDGSANTQFLTLYTKYLTFKNRLERLDKTEDDLI
jgi:hypothetical protein